MAQVHSSLVGAVPMTFIYVRKGCRLAARHELIACPGRRDILTIDQHQADSDALVSATGQDGIDARPRAHTLVIQHVHRIPDDWPELPQLRDLAINAAVDDGP